MANVPIDTPSGPPIRLADVATVALKPNPNAIERQGDSRRSTSEQMSMSETSARSCVS